MLSVLICCLVIIVLLSPYKNWALRSTPGIILLIVSIAFLTKSNKYLGMGLFGFIILLHFLSSGSQSFYDIKGTIEPFNSGLATTAAVPAKKSKEGFNFVEKERQLQMGKSSNTIPVVHVPDATNLLAADSDTFKTREYTF